MDLRSVNYFSLDIKEGPIVEYLNSLGLNFVRTFHIGCSQDNRHPSFSFYAEKNDSELVSLFYDRTLAGALQVYPRDERGERDIEALARGFSNPEYCWERLDITRRLLSGNLVHNARITLNLENNKILFYDLYDLKLVAKNKLSLFWDNLADNELQKDKISPQELIIEFLKIYCDKTGNSSALKLIEFKTD